MIFPHPLRYVSGGGSRKLSLGRRLSFSAADLRKLPWKKITAWTALVLLSVTAILVVAFSIMVVRLRDKLPSALQIATYQPPVGTKIYSSDGVLLATLQMENRQVVPLKKISPHLVAATLAVEDDRFYQHGAVDPKGLARAAWVNLTTGNPVGQGGSTLSMQLARNVEEFGLSREKRFERKLREIMTATRIEQVFTKNEILELYLNQIYYGSGAYGVEAASRTYFGKPASKLTLSEAAMLAGLPRRPEYYVPSQYPERAKDRRNVVLARMLETGRIDRAPYEKAVSESVNLKPPKTVAHVLRAPYFVDWVVRDLVKQYGVDRVYGGMKIVTTLDWRMQEAAEKAVRNGLSHGATQAALVSLDPHTGEVRAMVGGLDYKKDRFNAITQGRRQPGSAFKPLVYAAAFDSGVVMLNDDVTDDPISAKSGNKLWTVRNYGGGYSHKTLLVKEAITRSVNTVAVKVAAETGIDQVVRYAKAMGISTELAPYLSLSLGASAVRPIELTAAFGHFAAEGPRYDPIGLKQVQDRRGRYLEVPSRMARIHGSPLQASTVSQVNIALRSVVTEGTGYAANVVPNAFGKTGTTSSHRDAWFVGYTPELVTTVWAAAPYRDKKGVIRYRTMGDATGGRVAAPIWARFMKSAVPIQKRVNALRKVGPYAIHLPPPDPVEESLRKAKLAQKDKNTEEMEHLRQVASWFAGTENQPAYELTDRGTVERRGELVIFRPSRYGVEEWRTSSHEDEGSSEQPQARTDRNGMVRVCADTGALATRWCPASYGEDPKAGSVPRSHCRQHVAPAGE